MGSLVLPPHSHWWYMNIRTFVMSLLSCVLEKVYLNKSCAFFEGLLPLVISGVLPVFLPLQKLIRYFVVFTDYRKVKLQCWGELQRRYTHSKPPESPSLASKVDEGTSRGVLISLLCFYANSVKWDHYNIRMTSLSPSEPQHANADVTCWVENVVPPRSYIRQRYSFFMWDSTEIRITYFLSLCFQK